MESDRSNPKKGNGTWEGEAMGTANTSLAPPCHGTAGS